MASLLNRQHSPETVEKVKEQQTRQRETDLKENGFWANALEDTYRYDMDPKLILAYDELVKSVSRERIQAAARRYLDPSRTVIGVLYPEAPVGAVSSLRVPPTDPTSLRRGVSAAGT